MGQECQVETRRYPQGLNLACGFYVLLGRRLNVFVAKLPEALSKIGRGRSGCAITSLSSCLSWANSHSAHGCSYRRRDGGLVFCYGLTTDRWADIRAITFDGEHGRRWEWKRRVRVNDFSKNLRWCVFSQCPKMSCKCHSGHRGY